MSATSASATAIESITRQGYVRLPAVFDGTETRAALNQVHQLAATEAATPPRAIPRLDRGQQTVYNLQNKSLALLRMLLHQALVRQILMHFLNDTWHRAIPHGDPNYILRSFSARNNLAASPMHIDSFIPFQGGHAVSMQVAIVLETQSAHNGATLVVPGTHQSGEYVDQAQRDIATAVESHPGDVVIWDSRIWHGTGENRSGASRWSLIATFVRWWVKQGYRITERLPQSVYRELGDSDKAVLGFCALPGLDESDGIDFKTPYASLKAHVDDYR